MIVTKSNMFEIIEDLKKQPSFALDLETTGLLPYKGDRLFSMAISTQYNQYYFNFNKLSDHRGAMSLYSLDKSILVSLLNSYKGKVFIHNAKFDMSFLDQEGVDIDSLDIHCTYAVERLINNDRVSYGLDALGKEIFGIAKDDTVKKYVSKHKLYRWIPIPGKRKREKVKYFDLVPIEIMQPYAELDAQLCYMLGTKQLFKIGAARQTLYENEMKLTKALYRMEKVGVKIDKAFTKEAQNASLSSAFAHSEQFKEISNLDHLDSAKVYERAFRALDIPFPKTEKGNPSFSDDFLATVDHPIAFAIHGFRMHNKKAGTYFSNFLYLMDNKDVVHCNFKQGGTASGRLSCSNPNLQNINKNNDEGDYPVRKCFIPREGYFFAMLDYDQMEYRLMLDYAGQLDLIQEINNGLDVHEATGKLMGVDRATAKTINFMLLYGGGTYKLAKSLDISMKKAAFLRGEYFRKLPRIQKFIERVQQTAEEKGYVENWLGRRCRFNKDTAYKAPNYLIQGGCADVVKAVMVILDEFLKNYKSRMVMTIHDEVVFEIHNSEDWIVPYLQQIMENTYPHKHIKLGCGVETSKTNWCDKEEE